MRTTLLVTSIPPPFNKDGIDVSKHQWTNLCINSWFKTGHDVVSINTDYEINQIKEFYHNPDLFWKLKDLQNIEQPDHDLYSD